ncbi:MAG: sugar ABC transporter ATP-binding protein [Actinobacteria bacterium]|nr:sugar ABC transporter ATP-binding protein [Cyanobacteriota bacterium]MCL5771145.1 sugar ABC transporter ATP-binding protein [Actinomycetota bacterium]
MGSKEDSIIEIKGVYKTFNGVVNAIEDISIAIRQNEIVGVVGENGAGKSTLMKVLVGVFPPDKGELYCKGEKVLFPKNPKEAARRGISIVYQEKGVIPCLKVYQFLFLGHEDKYEKMSNLNLGKMRKYAREILEEFHVNCDVDSFMYELPLSVQKMVEIAKAILNVRLEHGDNNITSVIILDEPTAPLTIEERKKLFSDILRMKKNVSFIFVSHIIPEVMEFTDRIHVLRDGRLVANFDLTKSKITEEDLFKEIVGKESSEHICKHEIKSNINEKIALSAMNLTKNGCYYDISFDLHKGECIGIFGTAGSGKSEIINTIAGVINYDSGTLMIKGRKVKAKELPYARLKRGVGYFSGEIEKNLFLNWPVTKNISILNIEKILSKFISTMNFKAEKQLAKKIIDRLRIKTDVNADCYSLSGGTKQKISVGKWLEKSPDILLLENPTIGIDVGARNDIYETILDMNKSGISIILVSDDPEEYYILCNKIFFLKEGRIQKVLSPEKFKEVMST